MAERGLSIPGPGNAPSENPGGKISAPQYTTLGDALAPGLKTAGDFGASYADHMDRLKTQDDQAAVTDAAIKYHTGVGKLQYGDPDDPSATGFLTTQGLAAQQGFHGFAQSADRMRADIAGTLTPEQADAFNRQVAGFQASAINAAGEHAAAERQAYQKQTFQAGLDNTARQGAGNASDPRAFASGLLTGRQQIASFYAARGMSPDDPIVQNEMARYGDGYFRTASLSLRDSGDPIAAQNMLESNRRNMSPIAYAEGIEANKAALTRKTGEMVYQAASNGGAVSAIPLTASQASTYATMTHLESGGQQMDRDGKPLTSSKGAVGTAQLMPDTARQVASQVGVAWDENRFRTDGAYNRALGEAYFGQLVQRYGGNQTLACAAYNAGPGRVDDWCRKYGDPRQGGITDQQFVAAIPFDETRNYVTRAAAAQTPADNPPSYQPPDWAGRARYIAGAPIDEDARSHAVTLLNRDKSIWEAGTATARGQLEENIKNLAAAYAAGNVTHDIPEAQIRTLYAPEDADRAVTQLKILHDGADLANSLQYAPPDEVARVQANAAADMRTGEDITAFNRRKQVASVLNGVIKQHQQAMTDDPVSYVAGSPSVQQATQALQSVQDSGDAGRMAQAERAYAQQSMAMQRYLAPNQPPRLLTNGQVDAIGQTLRNYDPAKGDVLAPLQQLEQSYGHLWPQALGEAIQRGKLDPDTQMLASMGNDTQAAAREIFAGSLKFRSEELEHQVPTSALASIRPTGGTDPVEDALSDMRATMTPQAGGGALYSKLHDAVYRQALNYAARGTEPDAAIRQAAGDFIRKYDTSGTIRAPKGEMRAVRSALALCLDALNGDAIQPPASNLNISADDRADYGVGRAKSTGQWVMNSDETGYNLVVPTRSPGQQYVVKNRDGSPLTVTLRDIRSGALLPTDQFGAGTWAARKARYAQENNRQTDTDRLAETVP